MSAHGQAGGRIRVWVATSAVLGSLAILVLSSSVSFAAAPTTGPHLRWVSAALRTSAPGSRDRFGLVYDPLTNTTILYGGYNPGSGGVFGDMWSLVGRGTVGSWKQLSPATSPGPRANFGMVYDPALSGILLFGGIDSSFTEQNSTWLWSGGNWTQLTPSTAPSPREEFAMAWDALDQEVLLFGGVSSGTVLGDCWAFAGGNWSSVPTPALMPAREFGAMAYDGVDHETILTTGFDASGLNSTGTWAFAGGSWQLLSGAHTPSGRQLASATTLGNGYVALFGGLEGNSGTPVYSNATYLFHGGRWYLAHPAGHAPSARKSAGFAYDSLRKAVVLFGGNAGPPFYGDTYFLV